MKLSDINVSTFSSMTLEQQKQILNAIHQHDLIVFSIILIIFIFITISIAMILKD